MICPDEQGFPTESTYTTMRELGPIIPSIVCILGPNSLVVVYIYMIEIPLGSI